MASSTPTSSSFKNKSHFSTEENIALCKAWLEITSDGIIGSAQTSKRLWSCIHTAYIKLMVGTTRTENSVKCHFGIISKECSRFLSHKISCQKESGYTQDDLDSMCLATYNAKYNHNFSFMECFILLQNNAKWSDIYLPVKAKSNFVDLGADGDFGSSPPSMERGIGRKKGKAMARSAQDSSERAEKFITRIEAAWSSDESTLEKNTLLRERELQERQRRTDTELTKFEQKKARLALKQKSYEMKVLSTDLYYVSGPELELMKKLKQEVLAQYGYPTGEDDQSSIHNSRHP